MAQVINTNIASLNAQINLNSSQYALSKSLARLSSGLRINRAQDDAANMAIAERMNAQVRGLAQAQRNANDGISLTQTAEGALNTVNDMLQRGRELAVQAANSTNQASDRASIHGEWSQLADEVERVANTTEFNGQKLLDGSFSATLYQTGANSGEMIAVAAMGNMTAAQLGQSDQAPQGLRSIDLSTAQGARDAIAVFDAAIDKVSSQRAELGATQNRFASTINNLSMTTENLSAARSRITDADFVKETANFSRDQVLQQAKTAMLAQANQLPQGVLSLLRN